MAFFHEDTHRRWVYTLQIAGVPTRYTSAPGVRPSPIEGDPSGRLYDDIPCMLADDGISEIDESLDLLRSAYDAGSVSVRLAALPGSSGDPRRLFSRSGRRAASSTTIVTRTIRAGLEAPLTVYVGNDMSFLSYPRHIHIGGECMYATGAEGSQPDPDEADPYRVTVTARAVGGTRLASHIVRGEALDYPILTTDEVVFFQNRPAIILAEPADGSEPPAVIVRGFLDEAPDPEPDGSVTVVVLPLTALLDRELELAVPDEHTTLVQGYHLFSAQAGSVFEMHCQAPSFHRPARDGTAPGSGVIDLSNDAIVQHDQQFDHTRPFGHPRAGDVFVGPPEVAFYDVTGYAADGGVLPESLSLADGPDAAVPVEAIVSARWATETRRAYIIEPGGDDEILTWPGVPEEGDDGAVNRINAALDVATHEGEDGSFVGMRLTGSVEDGMTAHLTRLSPLVQDAQFYNTIMWLDGIPAEFDAGSDDTWPSGDGPRLPLLTSTADVPDIVAPPEAWDADGPLPPLDSTLALYFPLVWTSPASWGETGVARYEHRVVPNGERAVALHDVAAGFYQRGEPAILVESLLDITQGSVRIEHDENTGRARDSGGVVRLSRVSFSAAVTEIDPVVLAVGPRAGDTVYKLTLADPFEVPSFGDFTRPGMESGITISARREADFSTPTDALAWLLTNQNALGLSQDEVDLASIRRYPPTPWDEPFSLPGVKPDGSISFRDMLDGILRMTRSALVMRGPDHLGRTRLTLVSTGFAVRGQEIEAIAEGEWAAEPEPSSRYNRDVCNRLEVSTHYDPVEDELARTVAFNEKASQATYGKQSTESIDAYGYLPENPASDLFLMSRGIFEAFSEPRREWRGRVATHRGLRLGVGALVRVGHPRLLDHAGLPVVAGIGQVVGRRLGLWSEGAELTIEAYPVSGSGWNGSLLVVEVISAVAVRVADNAYSDPERLNGSGVQRDVDCAPPGTKLYCEPAREHDGGIHRSVVSVVDDIVTLAGAHGLVVGDSLIPPPADDANAAQLVYAYLGTTDVLV